MTNRISDVSTTLNSHRTREEILLWLQQARERKEAFQRKVSEEWEARQIYRQ